MTSLRARLLAGAVLGTTLAFAIGGVVVHQLARMRLERDTDAGLENVLGFAVERLKLEFGNRELLFGSPVRPGSQLLIRPTDRLDTLFVCRTQEGVLIDASDELGEATAMIDLPNATLDVAVFGNFVLADGSLARGAALAFQPEHVGTSTPDAAARANGAEPGVDGVATAAPSAPRLIVLQSVAAREASLRYLALILLSTWLFTCFIGSAALWLTIRRGLRPLEDLRLRIADLDWRSGSAPVEIPGAPDELAPVIVQLEASRQRIVSAFRRERRFAGDAAHELRTPVSGIKAILEVALRRERSAEELRGYARECLAIASEMGSAVEALLTLGKLSRGEVALELTDVDVAALAEEAWKPLAFTAEERSQTLVLECSTPTVVGNRGLLSRAIANLIDNAVEYGDAPGVVRVTCRRSETASVIEITNPLSDVPIGFEDHAFEPFWRGDSARTEAARHAGLGLALVNQIAELHGGEASVSAQDGLIVARIVIPDA